MTSSTPARSPGLPRSPRIYDAVLCDLWGVVHNGIAAYPSAVDALVHYRKAGRPGGPHHQCARARRRRSWR